MSDREQAAFVQDPSDTADDTVPGLCRWLSLIEHSISDHFDDGGGLDILTEEAAQRFDGCEKAQFEIV